MDSLIIQAGMDNLEKMIRFIEERYSILVSNKKMISQMRLVTEEVLMNIIHYAYPGEKGNVEIDYEYDPDNLLLTISFIDEGISFNPLEVSDPKLNVEMENRKVGGLGIFLIKKLMDFAQYERQNNHNILKLQKRVNA